MTYQLASEKTSVYIFNQYCKTNGIEIKKRISSSENRQLNTDADFLIEINGQEYTASLKTTGGVFTKKNLGAGVLAAKKWIKDPTDLEKIKIAVAQSNKLKDKICQRYSITRWEELPTRKSNRLKNLVCYPLLKVYYEILLYGGVANFINYLENNKSDLHFVCDLKTREVYNYFSNSNLTVDGIDISLRRKTIYLLGSYTMRFKSEGGKVKSSIKINVQ